MKNTITILCALLLAFSFTSCRHGRTGPQGEPGQNGAGIPGKDGVDAIGFDYVRGMDGAQVCGGAVVVDAAKVVPEAILALAPAEDPFDPDGLTLTFGTIESPIRLYLGVVRAGQLCVIEKGEGVLGQLRFAEDGYVAVVPPAAVTALGLTEGVIVEFEGCKVLDYSRWKLRIGKKIVVRID